MKFETQNIYFISDFHIGHANVIRFDNRPYKDIHEMSDVLADNWNSVVGEDDHVFFLGDLSYKSKPADVKKFVDKLNGRIYAVIGNHDRVNELRNLKRFETIDKEYNILIKDDRVARGYQELHLSHYPILSWNNIRYGSIHLHGHTHQNMLNSGQYDWFYKRRVMDVGCNGINYTPISYDGVMNIMLQKSELDKNEFL